MLSAVRQSRLSSFYKHFGTPAHTCTAWRVGVHCQHNRRQITCSASPSMFAGPGSEELRRKGCGVCDKDTPKVPEEELPKLLAAIPLWTLAENNSALSRKFVAKNFKAAIDFINKAAEVAEAESHHPDLHLTNYREVELKVSTHAVGGLTHFDFVLAAKLDEVPVDYSPKWLEKAQAALQQGKRE